MRPNTKQVSAMPLLGVHSPWEDVIFAVKKQY